MKITENLIFRDSLQLKVILSNNGGTHCDVSILTCTILTIFSLSVYPHRETKTKITKCQQEKSGYLI